MRCLLLAALFVFPLWAQPPELLNIDNLSRRGLFERAESEYSRLQRPELKPWVLVRRLQVALATRKLARFRALSDELEELRRSQELDPEVGLRYWLTRGQFEVGLERWSSAEAHYQQAQKLARSWQSSGASLARYECASFDFLKQQASGSAQDTLRAYSEAAQLALSRPAGGPRPYWPLDLSRTTFWTRRWVQFAIEQAWEAWYRGDPAGSWAWKQASIQMAEQSSSGFRQFYQGTRSEPSTEEPEAAFAATLLLLDLAQGYPQDPTCSNWLASALVDLEASERIIREPYPPTTLGGLRLPQDPPPTMTLGGLRLPQDPPPDGLGRRGLYYWALARQQHCQGKLEPAQQSYRQAQSYLERAGWQREGVDLGLDLAEQLGQGELGPLLQRSVQMGYLPGQLRALALEASRHQLQGRPSQALQAYAQGLEVLQASRIEQPSYYSKLWAQRGLALLDGYLELLVQQGQVAEAQRVLLLQQQLQASAELDWSQLKSQLRQQQQQLWETQWQLQQAQPADLAPLQARLQQQRQEFYLALEKLRDGDLDRMLSLRPTAFSKLQSQLPEEVLLVAYYPGPKALYLFCADRRELKVQQVALPRPQLESEIHQVRRELAESLGFAEVSATTQARLQRLYQALIEPLKPQLKPGQTLLIVPSGALHYLPFAALIAGPEGPSSRPEYLIASHPLAVESNAQMLEVLARPAPPPPRRLLALANPDGSLPGAVREAEQIKEYFAEPVVLLGAQAQRQQLAKVDCQVLHLATHGQVVPAQPSQSYLVLAASQVLTVADIFALDLSGVSLVTLSACKTALAGPRPQAEITSLAQAFSVAGSRSVLGSLWSVEDQATAQLMVEFYRRYCGGKSAAVALQQAQLSLLQNKSLAHPYCWSGFTLLGDWR